MTLRAPSSHPPGSIAGRLGLATATLLGSLLLAVVPAFAATSTVELVDKAFKPAEIVIAQGDTVHWQVTKAIGELHSVTSGKAGDANAGSEFDSKLTLRDNGQAFDHKFDTAGTYDYFCTVHPVEMKGRVVVLAPGQSAPPAAATASPEPAQPGEAGVSDTSKILAVVILLAAVVVLSASALLYRRVNR